MVDSTLAGSGTVSWNARLDNNKRYEWTFRSSFNIPSLKPKDRDKLADPSNMDFTKVQRVNYAFFQPDVNGKIFGTDRWGDPQLLFGPYDQQGAGGGVQRCSYDGPNEVNCAYHEHNSGLINRAHSQGAEVYPSIGGWTLSDPFPILSANPVSREAFARNCVEILGYHDFDGIDIDWEVSYVDAFSL